MVKVKNGIATREPIPAFLIGLAPESLADLSWTDPQLGVQDCAWWPEDSADGELAAGMKRGTEILTPDLERQVVIVTHEQAPLSDEERAALAATWAQRIADRRFQAETGGAVVEGLAVNTERDSQSLLTGAAFAASLDPEYRIKWKTASGFVELTGAQVIALASAVRAHVQACFDREAELLAAVADGSITAEMLEQGWP
ncbi:DUF4376 domain-containing protein [Pseudomonas guariconensis]|uniref:DUF4376 domain-containing protein n=2 Tax=Pseudomonas guariconensis TaxID=1288410 RepID=UPI0025A974EB|nr:DUF4376 domain-containing protein [Pseudomonas guariconensis]MDM9594733.1 DUF4376 domain-containing protein [Pseudomonas guariconensis]MDM9607564.1 DUF4376 domain-containing protein [Pseudomonas guariconensis]MDM9612521.1 DUF4376 domain-containing protein [Pseudomonas guariconensis]